MLRKIFPIIASVILIAIFALLFNLSLPKFENFVAKSRVMGIAGSNTKEFLGSLSADELERFRSLPCTLEPGKCPNLGTITKRFLTAYKSDKVEKTLILTTEGAEIFSGKKIDVKYVNLIAIANQNGSSELIDSSGDAGRIIIIRKISEIKDDRSLQNKFVLLLTNKGKLGLSTYRIVFGLICFLPVLVIIIYFLKRKENALPGEIKPSGDSNNYAAEIEALKRQNVQQSQFLANFTHELRTPLNSIIGFSGLLKDQTLGALGNPEYVKYSNDINTSGVHLLSLINDILDYSKSEVGKLKVNITEVDIIKIIKQSLSIIAPRASESKVDLLQSFANDYFIIRLDPKRFKQIMLNLLSNSVKFTPEGGSVMVSVFPDIKGESVSVEVKDTGVGIAEKDIPTVMALFGQVETDLNRKYEGTGIGLPFAKKLTQLMGGEFDLQSRVGVGTRITLVFPFDKRLNAEYATLYKKPGSE